MNEANYRGYDPASDYFQTGLIGTESVTLSTGTEHNQTYLSAAAVNSRGIIPNNKYDRYNFTFRIYLLYITCNAANKTTTSDRQHHII